jgi:hypothetical protein
MFQHWRAILMESTRTKEYQPNTPSTRIGVLDWYSFVLEDSLRMALRCRNMSAFDTCHELYFMICIVLYCILFGELVGYIDNSSPFLAIFFADLSSSDSYGCITEDLHLAAVFVLLFCPNFQVQIICVNYL